MLPACARVPHAASLCIAGSARACPRESGEQVITTPWPPLLRGKASTQCRHIDLAKRISPMNRLLTEENLSLQVVFLKNLPLSEARMGVICDGLLCHISTGKRYYMPPLMGLEMMRAFNNYKHNVPNGTFQTRSNRTHESCRSLEPY